MNTHFTFEICIFTINAMFSATVFVVGSREFYYISEAKTYFVHYTAATVYIQFNKILLPGRFTIICTT